MMKSTTQQIDAAMKKVEQLCDLEIDRLANTPIDQHYGNYVPGQLTKLVCDQHALRDLMKQLQDGRRFGHTD